MLFPFERFLSWAIKPKQLKNLSKGTLVPADLRDDDYKYELTQKGVDMRLGLDVASLAYKKHVSRIVLVTGDADFVPAAKLARREGLDVILDPMWQRVDDKLYLHIDGLDSKCKRPSYKGKMAGSVATKKKIAAKPKATKVK